MPWYKTNTMDIMCIQDKREQNRNPRGGGGLLLQCTFHSECNLGYLRKVNPNTVNLAAAGSLSKKKRDFCLKLNPRDVRQEWLGEFDGTSRDTDSIDVVECVQFDTIAHCSKNFDVAVPVNSEWQGLL